MSDPFEPELSEWGLSPFFQGQILEARSRYEAPLPVPARVLSVHRDEFLVTTGSHTVRAILSGKLSANPQLTSVAVGDWVLCEEPGGGIARIVEVIERTSLLARNRAGGVTEVQPIAANVDLAVIVVALAESEALSDQAHTLNAARTTRYLHAIARAGIRALVVINKIECHAAPRELTAQFAQEIGGRDLLLVSALTGAGFDALEHELRPGQTAVLMGASGVGKSTLLNRLLAREAQRVSDISADRARGRHTTTHRELFRLPNGALLVDTPGMREFLLWAEAEADTGAFADVETLAKACRFADCSHTGEPGCAIAAEVARGGLSAERVQQHDKLQRELAFQARRHDTKLSSEERKKHRALTLQIRERKRD